MAGLCEVTATFEFGFDYHEGGINGVYPKYRQQFTFPSPSTDVDFTADYCLVQRSKDGMKINPETNQTPPADVLRKKSTK